MKELTLLPSQINPRSPEGQDQMHQRESMRGFQIKTNFKQARPGVFAFLTTQLSEMQDDTTSMLHILKSMAASSPSVMIQVGLGWRASD
jgi:hypothetical protein